MSWLSELFHGGKNPADAANNYLDQIPGATKPYYQPYIDQGRTAGNDLTGRYNDMLNNPGDLYNKFGAGYKESPGYQERLKQALQAVTNSEAAGGMAGSQEHQQLGAQKAVDMSSKDFEDYLNHILGIYGGGLSGEQGREERGFKASTGYGDILGQTLGTQGQYAYAGQAGQNANQSNLFSNALKFGATALGYGLGGPLGGAAVGGGLNLLPNRSYG